jgi:hypothetical protein
MKGIHAVLTIVSLAAVLPISRADVAGTHAADTSRNAAVFPLPAAAYPPRTHITYYAEWTNQQFDCNFGWFCDSDSPQPFVHIMTEDQLHRADGWAVWGDWHGDRMGFELYPSVYVDGTAPTGTSWNQAAATDERTMLVRVLQARAARTTPSVLPDGVTGGAFAYYLDRPYWHVLFITAWWGATHEIEAAVLYPLKQRWEARRYLIEQVRLAAQAAETVAYEAETMVSASPAPCNRRPRTRRL